MSEPAIYLSSVGHVLGGLVPISSVSEFAADPAALERFESLGIENCAVANAPMKDMVVASLTKTLSDACVGREQVAGLVLASSSLEPDEAHDLSVQVAAELGLTHAVPYGVFLGQCANWFLAMTVARGLAGGLGSRQALLVASADQLPATGWSRVVANGASVFSDGVASCLLTTFKPRRGYRVMSIGVSVYPSVYSAHRSGSLLEYIQEYAIALQKVSAEACRAGGIEITSVHKVVGGNYNRAVLRNYVPLLGVRAEQVFDEHVSRFGHCFSADQLIALAELQERRTEVAQPKYLLLGNGMHVWGGAVVERVSE
jgi:3-oxoacyl-[acyl-carrier-protein] synthase III